MSGGSFEYLCYKEIDEILQRLDLLESMSHELALLGYADDVSRETTEFMLSLRAFKVRYESHRARLSPVWKAMEWWQSGDIDEDDFKESLAEYRKEAPDASN